MTNLTTNGLPNSAGQLTGFPNPDNDSTKVRKIALVNGSQYGLLLPGSACGQALRVEIDKTVAARVLLFLFTRGILGGSLPVSKKLIDATAYFAPSGNNSCKIFEGTSVYPLGIGIPGKTRFANAYNSGTGLDLSPGGRLDIQNVIATDALRNDAGFLGAFINVKVTNPTPNQTFIPTKSSLAYNWKVSNGMGDLGENLSNRNLVCERIIPFDTYYAPLQNEDHVFLTAQSAAWVLKEINGSKQKPISSVTFLINVNGRLNCTASDSTITASIPARG